MGLRMMLLGIDWPSVSCFLSHVLSASALPTLTKLLISHLHFPYPATLSFIHTVTISICLWYWTILSIFKPRSIPILTLIPLSLSAAINTLLNAYMLAKCSLLHYQIVRFLPLVVMSPNIHSAPLLLGTMILFMMHPPKPMSAIVLVASLVFALIDRHGPIARLRRATRATDLQLQLLVRSMSAVFIGVWLPTLDDLSRDSDLVARLVGLDDPTSFFLYSTGLIAFFSFISIRVSHSKLHPHAFRIASIISAAPIFFAHFLIYASPRMLDILSIILVLAGAHHATLAAQSEAVSEDDDVCSNSSDSQSDDAENPRVDDVPLPVELQLSAQLARHVQNQSMTPIPPSLIIV